MSANIYENELTGQASFFTVKEPAWHRLGKVLDEPITAQRAIVEAGLDFEVEKQKLFLEDGTQAKGAFVTMRMDTNKQLGIVGSRYTVLQNKDAFGFFDAVVDADEAIYETAGVLGKGEKIWIMAKMPERFSVVGTGSDDEVETFVVLMNSHDMSTPIIAFTTHVRVVCSNTLNAALANTVRKISIRHTASAEEQLSTAHEILGITNQLTSEMKLIWGEMAKKEITDKFIDEFLEDLLPVPEPSDDDDEEKAKRTPRVLRYRTEIKQSFVQAAGQDMPGVRDTAWGLYNGTTFWIDHIKNYRNGDSGRLNATWLGTGADLRQKAFDKIVEYTFN
jgi:phage/plasmid-like protein (TIGR03299 family)